MGEGEEVEAEAEGEEEVVLDSRWAHMMVDKFELVGVVVGSRLVHMMVGKLEPVVRPLELDSSLDRM